LFGIVVDSLKIFEILKSGSLSEENARVMTLAIQQADSESSSDMKGFIHRELGALTATFVTKVEFESRLAALETRLLRWMFAFWIGQMVVVVGLVLEVSKLLK
jgi:hypothetical protein